MIRKIAVFLLACRLAEAVKLTRPGEGHNVAMQQKAASAEAKDKLTADQVDEIRQMLVDENIIYENMVESPYIRISFHIASTYDAVAGRGGWNEYPTRAEMRAESLLDNVLILYWDVLEDYHATNVHRMHGISMPDFLSFVTYLYCLDNTYSPNVTWRAGRSDSKITGDHMSKGRPNMPEGLTATYKPDPNMSSPEYLREFYSRLGFTEDEDVVDMMFAHTFGSARGYPYLGNFKDTCDCYFERLLTYEWVRECPSQCDGCVWSADTHGGGHNTTQKDPYGTMTISHNWTNKEFWGENCTSALARSGLYEYTNAGSKDIFRLPADMALTFDDNFRAIMATKVGHMNQMKAGFGRVMSRLMEVGVPEEDLYEVVSYTPKAEPAERYT